MICRMFNKPKTHFISSNKQLVYGVVLVIVIPLLVVANSLFFIREFNNVLTHEQQRQAILIGEVTESFVLESLDSPETLQRLISETISRNSELTDFLVSVPQDGELVVVASANEDRVATINNTTSAFFSAQKKESIAQRVAKGDEQFWLVQYPITDIDGGVVALLSIELSTNSIDTEAGALLLKLFIILAVIVLVIIFLLASNTKLFQYAILYKRLKEIDSAKDDFISIASHELRTPITAMRNYFSMLKEGSFGALTKETEDSVVMMTANAERLNNLVEDLLNVSRLQQGRISIEKENIDMVALVSESVTTLQSMAHEKKLSLTFQKPEGQIMAHADPERLRQVVINIVGNALKYTKDGSVSVMLKIDKKFVSLKVKDTGIGMSAQAQERLFEKFYRVQNEKTQNIVGTGLGLWLTRELVDLMGGKIFIDSIEGVGTQVTITMPLAKEVEKK